MQLATLELNILKSSLWGTAIAVPQEFDEGGGRLRMSLRLAEMPDRSRA